MNLLLFSNTVSIITGGISFLWWRKARIQRYRQEITEKQLRDQLTFVRSILDSLPAMVAFRNTNHQLLFCNKAYKSILAADFWLRMENPPSHSLSPLPLRVSGDGETSGEFAYTDIRDNTQKYATCSHQDCHDVVGNKTGQLMVLTDITPVKHAEQRAREAETRLTLMTDSIPGMVFQYLWQGPDNGRFLYTSKGIETILGVTRQEMMSAQGGGNRLFGFTEVARLQFVRDIAEHAQQLQPVDLDISVPRQDGLHYLQVRGNFTLQEDGSRILNGVIQDITGLKQQELELRAAREAADVARHEAEQAMQARSRFLATMSHELRTPISGMHGMLELLQVSELSEEQRYMVRSVTGSANTLLYLVNDLLDLSGIEAGKLQLHCQPCLLQPAVCDVIRGHAARATGKGLTVSIHWDPAIPQQASIDAMRVGQVISNLLNNAVKFTHQGSITITATCAQNQLSIVVSDTGIGIPLDRQHCLFTPFEQLESDISRRYGGTGLGLAICDQLARKMGGSVSLKSEAGQGAAFTFTFPLQTCQWQDTVLTGSEWWSLCDVPGLDEILKGMGATVRPLDIQAWSQGASGLLLADECSLTALLGDNWLTSLQSRTFRGIIFSAREPLRSRMDAMGWWRLGTSPLYPDLLLDTCGQLLSSPASRPVAIQHRPLSGRVLVADDHPVNRALLARQLAMFNLDVVLVENGERALQAWLTSPFDLVLTDIHMPEMDGYTLTRTLRAGGASVPVIGITADLSAGAGTEMIACGMSDLLPKPYSLDNLTQLLHHWLPIVPAGTPVHVPPPPESDMLKTARTWMMLFGEEAVARSMAEEYLLACQQDCDAMFIALKTGSTAELADIAHRIKGSARMVSHDALAEEATELEHSVRACTPEELQIRVQSVQAAVTLYTQQTGEWLYGRG